MSLVDVVGTHAQSLALILARLVPIAFLCPVFGGPQAPTTVRLGLCLALGGTLHFAAGVHVEPQGLTELAAGAARELCLGMTIGLLAGLPFDTARMAGRFIDLFRGSSAEAALPLQGSRDTATGEGLHHLLLALACIGGVLPTVIATTFRTFALVPLGTFQSTESVALAVVGWIGTAMGAALALGAPVAAASLAIDGLLAVASRVTTGVQLTDLGTTLKLLAGGVVAWLMLGGIAQALLTRADAWLHAVPSIVGT